MQMPRRERKLPAENLLEENCRFGLNLQAFDRKVFESETGPQRLSEGKKLRSGMVKQALYAGIIFVFQIYTEESPNSCSQLQYEVHQKRSLPRICNWRNETISRGSCATLCCGRGYSVSVLISFSLIIVSKVVLAVVLNFQLRLVTLMVKVLQKKAN